MFKILCRTVILTITLITLNSCSSDSNEPEIIDNRNISTSTDFFINFDETVSLKVTGDFRITTEDILNFGNEQRRGFIYSKSPNETPNTTNTLVVAGPSTEFIHNLPKGENYFIRGFFQMQDNSYFFGDEIQATTNVDASDSRTITLEIESTPILISQTEVTPRINISNLTKEVPTEIGYEYSVNNDFSNSATKAIGDYNGATIPNNSGILLQPSYTTEVISGLTASTTYFFRPYAKYADGTVTNGGNNTASFTTNN
jgi:hypothetical protein